jgi:hypothetical protein
MVRREAEKQYHACRIAILLALTLVLPACPTESRSSASGTSDASGSEASSIVDNGSSVASPTTMQPSTPAALDADLASAFERFRDSPPSIHGTYEYRSERETIRYEMWVDWPAFRFEMSGEEHQGPGAGKTFEAFTVATLDGKRFGVRDPLAEGPYETTNFGEGVWVLGPILDFFGWSPMSCVKGHAIGTEVILERTTIFFRCTKFDHYDQWIDSETGLVLRQITREPHDEPGWLGFVDVEFEPPLEPALFDPSSV